MDFRSLKNFLLVCASGPLHMLICGARLLPHFILLCQPLTLPPLSRLTPNPTSDLSLASIASGEPSMILPSRLGSLPHLFALTALRDVIPLSLIILPWARGFVHLIYHGIPIASTLSGI